MMLISQIIATSTGKDPVHGIRPRSRNILAKSAVTQFQYMVFLRETMKIHALLVKLRPK